MKCSADIKPAGRVWSRQSYQLHQFERLFTLHYVVSILCCQVISGQFAYNLFTVTELNSSVIYSSVVCNVCLFVGCFTAHQHLGHIGPTLGGDKEYIRRGIVRNVVGA
jgi:hypothetical protein